MTRIKNSYSRHSCTFAYWRYSMNLNHLTIKQASEGIRKKDFSVTELVSDCFCAIKEKDSEIHAYLEIFEESARADAKKRDEEISHHNDAELSSLPALFGIPLAIKDNILIEGSRATAGSKMLAHYHALYDATVIKKLKKQRAIFLGKTNMDEFAMGSSTENSAFGFSRNPHDLSRVPGGSSGGSAAAVAADMCIAALGSDTGGSIRQPASFCGIAGFKPTYGQVSRHGLIAMASSLDQIGPMAKTVEDAHILFEAIRGQDECDSTTIKELNYELGIKNQELRNLKIGVPKEYFSEGLDVDVKAVITEALEKAKRAGARIEEITLPHSRFALPAYYIIVPSEVSANMARFDGIRYGYSVSAANRHEQRTTLTDTNSKDTRRDAENLYDVYTKTRAQGFGTEVKRRIMLGTYALSAGYYDAYYVKAQKVRRLITQDFDNAFKNVDIIAGPTMPMLPFRFGERTENPLQMYLADVYTVAVNLAGLPAVSVPAGAVTRLGSKLPVGLQFIGSHGKDQKLLSIARQFEQLT
ncbi:MAG: aspartyl-tRNA(Asn)/glutamyl-tRNA (Gln) amidotransferase subunit A [Parcubacteria group bacterium Gr01-1014_33]|nr:MAG: aspartyl-tRNA(Asn)/glutamyl-tRNA (Gln) amidotransferase subunit A [Parcubacteria group bacterium Gr01-1014_33]